MHKALHTWIVGISGFGEANCTSLFSVKRFDGYSWIANPPYVIATPMSHTAFWWDAKQMQHDSNGFMLNIPFKISQGFLLRLSAAVRVSRILNLWAKGLGYIKNTSLVDSWLVNTQAVNLCHFLIHYKCNLMSYPGNLTKSNSKDLWSSLVSTPELCSNKSLCQESDIPLIH